jgi:hypothetical protein
MNGRVYDPELGRFLSADPLIQFAESTQGFDRYAYVGNSPLSYTDPSGHGLLSVLGAIVSVASSAVCATWETQLFNQDIDLLNHGIPGKSVLGGGLELARSC